MVAITSPTTDIFRSMISVSSTYMVCVFLINSRRRNVFARVYLMNCPHCFRNLEHDILSLSICHISSHQALLLNYSFVHDF